MQAVPIANNTAPNCYHLLLGVQPCPATAAVAVYLLAAAMKQCVTVALLLMAVTLDVCAGTAKQSNLRPHCVHSLPSAAGQNSTSA
jgi:hypothetical protein